MAKLENIENLHGYIYRLRGQQVMLDRDLAQLYGVPTKSLNLAIRRNPARFPNDFMFQLSSRETADLRFQIETSSWGGRRYLPYAFTEEGIAMLSSYAARSPPAKTLPAAWRNWKVRSICTQLTLACSCRPLSNSGNARTLTDPSTRKYFSVQCTVYSEQAAASRQQRGVLLRSNGQYC